MLINLEEPRYMMATTAIHKAGDISRDTPDLCIIREEDEDNYYGEWILGFGFIGVRFPKSTTRKLTDGEILEWNGQKIAIGNAFHSVIELNEANT